MALIDIVDKNNQLTGRKGTYEEERSKGLWHRGVHAVIHTPDGYIVMQKRSPNFDYHPADVEISVGGGVDAGESPLQAIRREVREEIGLDIPAHTLCRSAVKSLITPSKGTVSCTINDVLSILTRYVSAETR